MIHTERSPKQDLAVMAHWRPGQTRLSNYAKQQTYLENCGLYNSLIEFHKILQSECSKVELNFIMLLEKQTKIINEFKQRVNTKLFKGSFSHYQTRTARLARSELELATSWSRAFSLIYVELRWLNAFSQLNRIAVNKSIVRMANNYLQISDNVLDKRLMIKAMTQYGPTFMAERQTKIIELQKEIVDFYA